MLLRPRASEQIRVDAIEMGLQKVKHGCLPCADNYFELAKQHGATEEEIRHALERATKTTSTGLSRRELLKIAAATGLALGTAGLHTGSAQALSTWWGTDSNTQTCCGMPQHFYIGRMGYGSEPVGDPHFFNTTAAQRAGLNHTYGYWGVVGPTIRPSGKSPYAWGQQQADHAWNARHNGPNASHLGGLTVFGDVEPGFGGWSFGNYGPNQATINGFLAELFAITPHYVWPGLYISPYYWTLLLGQGFRPTTAFVLWVTGCDTCGRDICGPCVSSCNTLTTVQRRLSTTVVKVGLGGMSPVLWQYWLGGCGCGDFNVATQDATSFRPATGGAIYSSPC